MPHRGEMIECSDCGFDLRDARAWFAHPEALKLSNALINRIRGNSLWGASVPLIQKDLEFFQTVRVVMEMFCSGIRAGWLRHEVSQYLGKRIKITTTERYNTQFEYLRVADLHDAFAMASVIFRGWPWMMVGLCAEARVWKSWALSDKERYDIPTLRSVVQDYLFDPNRVRL